MIFEKDPFGEEVFYFHHKKLNMKGKLVKSTGSIILQDLKKFGTRGHVEYSEKEIKILKSSGGISKEIHLIKNIFGGEIVED